MIDLALSVLPIDSGPQHVKLLLEWNEPDEFFCDTSDAFVEHESVSQLQVIEILVNHKLWSTTLQPIILFIIILT